MVLLGALSATGTVQAQSITAPGDDGSISWKGITLYGTIDVGLQYETHGAPFSDYYTPASTNIVQKDSRERIVGASGSNLSQTKIGLRGNEALVGDVSGVFGIETWFNPQAGDIADSLKSLTINNGRTPGQQTTDNDGASAGQAFQIAFVGLSSQSLGTLTFGRQQMLVADGMALFDPVKVAPAFSLLGASGTFAGAGTTEDKRMDSTLKYLGNYRDLVNFGVMYKFNNANGGSRGTGIQLKLGTQYAGFALEGYFSRIYDAVSLASLTAAQLAKLPSLGFSSNTSLAATISDNTAYAVMASYQLKPVPIKISGGYEHIQFANPGTDVAAGTTGLGGYIFAFVNKSAYANDRILGVYWAGARYTVIRKLDVTVDYYGYHQNAYGTGTQAGCSDNSHSTCSGSFRAYAISAIYRFSNRFVAYAGAMYSSVSGGLSNGYLYNTTNLNPTIGLRYSF